jgi:hypothetical protein
MSHVETVALAVSVQRVFIFPADLARTTAYFCDFTRVLRHLPHLRLITTHAVNQYRILYSATEAGVLHVTFFCDVQTHYDDANRTFHVDPLTGVPPVKQEAAFNAITGQGYYTSRSVFRPSGPNTQIAYRIEIKADLPRRRELDWMPKAIVKRLAEDVVRRRLREITTAFINRSLAEL